MVSPPAVDQLIVLAHPESNSFCASIARLWQERARKNHQSCGLRDLYADGFDPVLKAHEQPGKPGFAPVVENLAESERLKQLGVLVFVYPVWFGSPPAMLKGYLERVVGSNISFAADAQALRPLANVRMVQISTSASKGPWLEEMGIPGALHTIFERYVAEVFGVKHVDRLHLDAITHDMDDQHARLALAKVQELADRVCAEANADRWSKS